MIFRFNTAQLERIRHDSLARVLDVLQAENENELEVTAVEFPDKLKVKLDDDVELILGWDAEKSSYAGLTRPEPTPEPTPEPEFKVSLDMAGNVIPESLIKSEVGQRVDAIANAFVKLTMPFDADQRLEMWIAFTTTVFKELLK